MSETETRTDRWAGRLFGAIKYAGFRVDGFADRMHCHRVTLWRIERGDIKPTEEWAARADALLAIEQPVAA